MEGGAVEIVAPPPRVYRVARRGGDPFAPPPWDRAGPDGTFGNRFDDPSTDRGLAADERFRVIYCATTAEGALGETVARFRPSIALLAGLRDMEDDVLIDAQREASLDLVGAQRGIIPADWRLRRQLAAAECQPGIPFVNLAVSETHRYFRYALAAELATLGLDDFDFSTVAGPYRSLTQRIARHVYERHDRDGIPLFAGVRYLSRLDLEWECWAIFSDRMVHAPRLTTTIATDNEDLLAVCRLLNLSVETSGGLEVRPWKR